VSSRAGFETLGLGAVGELLSCTTTIVNNTESEISVRHGGASVEGHAALLLSVVRTNKGLNKRERKEVWELRKMSCFSSRSCKIIVRSLARSLTNCLRLSPLH